MPFPPPSSPSPVAYSKIPFPSPFPEFELTPAFAVPTGGSLFLYDRVNVKYFRNDGHEWRKKGDGKAVRETHEKLKLDQVVMLNCYYAHAITPENLQRRCYWLLDSKDSYVLVHYLQVAPETSRKSFSLEWSESGQQSRRQSFSPDERQQHLEGPDLNNTWMNDSNFKKTLGLKENSRASMESDRITNRSFSSLHEDSGFRSRRSPSPSVKLADDLANLNCNISAFGDSFIHGQPVLQYRNTNSVSSGRCYPVDSKQNFHNVVMPAANSGAVQGQFPANWDEPFNLNNLNEPLEKSLFEPNMRNFPTSDSPSVMPSESESFISDAGGSSGNSSLRGVPGRSTSGPLSNPVNDNARLDPVNLPRIESLGGLLPRDGSVSDLWSMNLDIPSGDANAAATNTHQQQGATPACLSICQMCPEVLNADGGETVLMLIGGADKFDFSSNYLCVSAGGIMVEPLTVNDNVVKFVAPKLSEGTASISLVGIKNGNQQTLSEKMMTQVRSNKRGPGLQKFRTGCDSSQQQWLIRSLLSRCSAPEVLSGLIK